MSPEQILCELIEARAEVAYLRSGAKTPWESARSDVRERFMSVARLAIEPRLLRMAREATRNPPA